MTLLINLLNNKIMNFDETSHIPAKSIVERVSISTNEGQRGEEEKEEETTSERKG